MVKKEKEYSTVASIFLYKTTIFNYFSLHVPSKEMTKLKHDQVGEGTLIQTNKEKKCHMHYNNFREGTGYIYMNNLHYSY
jgi:hypothetical protein